MISIPTRIYWPEADMIINNHLSGQSCALYELEIGAGIDIINLLNYITRADAQTNQSSYLAPSAIGPTSAVSGLIATNIPDTYTDNVNPQDTAYTVSTNAMTTQTTTVPESDTRSSFFTWGNQKIYIHKMFKTMRIQNTTSCDVTIEVLKCYAKQDMTMSLYTNELSNRFLMPFFL